MLGACESTVNSLGMYLSDVKERKQSEELDTEMLLARVAHGTPAESAQAREQLTIMYQPLIIGLAKRFVRQCELLDVLDLIQEGNLALLESIARYEAERSDTTFGVWARSWIKGTMRSAISRLDKQMAVPSRKLRHLQQLDAAEQEFRATRNRMPSIKELAAKLGMVPATVLDLVALRSRSITSLDSVDWSSRATLSLTTEPESSDDPLLDALRAALDALSSRQRTVINLRFGFADGVEHGHQAIADMLRISRSTVQQAEQAALVRLRHTMKAKQVQAPIAA
jgi:RNA polymerase sigma factor (sigma-70 family)